MPVSVNDSGPQPKGQPPQAQGAEGRMSDMQFARLVELLTPGYELSKLMLAEHKASKGKTAKADAPKD